MFYGCVVRFDVTKNLKNFVIFFELTRSYKKQSHGRVVHRALYELMHVINLSCSDFYKAKRQQLIIIPRQHYSTTKN